MIWNLLKQEESLLPIQLLPQFLNTTLVMTKMVLVDTQVWASQDLHSLVVIIGQTSLEDFLSPVVHLAKYSLPLVVTILLVLVHTT